MGEGLVGHWPLAADTDDHSGTGLTTRATGVVLGLEGPAGQPGTAAAFDGEGARLEVADHGALHFGRGDFTVSAWVWSEEWQSAIGSILSHFDADSRRGWQLYALTNDGVTSTGVANSRQLTFGADDGAEPIWTDCGRPGSATLVATLSVVNGELYAGTLEIGADQQGRLWRYRGGQDWVDLGNPLGTNIVHSVSEYQGALYAGVGRYACAGSVLGPTLNPRPGGKVFRVEADGQWVDCGHPGLEGAVPDEVEAGPYQSGKADDVFGLTDFHGDLYCISNHRKNVFRYEGGQRWQSVGLDHRIITLTVYREALHALVNGGPVYRYEGGEEWTYCGTPTGSTQTYGAVVCQGDLYVGTWPEGEVFRYAGGEEWEPLGRLGYEREVMAMALYNGKAYLGSLPMANVWRMDGRSFSLVGNLDSTPVMLRRVWSMAIHGGLLYAGTLPSGHVWSLRAGTVATCDRRLTGGWRHVAAVRRGDRLELHLDGNLVATADGAGGYEFAGAGPLLIGSGAYDHFRGRMSDVRLHERALGAGELANLANARGN